MFFGHLLSSFSSHFLSMVLNSGQQDDDLLIANRLQPGHVPVLAVNFLVCLYLAEPFE